MKTKKGTYESEISKAITQWEKDFLGRGSLSVKTDILRDMIIVSLQGVLTQAEYKVCETNEGLLTIKKTRSKLVESGIDALNEIVLSITGESVKGFHTDLSSRTGERVMIFKLYNDLEKQLIEQHK
ncbi:DUF2294 domain-containing protein [Staphylococcus gallinarum]|jgi:uncharacterized protein YbcI|uniref:DUF2294 domain-containing protein n=1 Tax=Staphylococcus gallinarum TaxID=1293 RepID=A0A0D0SJT2_STAGA|nr:DUF2294 domain-containing protein [Staphylococcus gallinarum]KIR12640.1 hypothetical protein SH09_00355 [Staphylococcus gallinarum]MBU7216541.1 DUF2294 domain-containing protein [Staphylococcus gallinarum]MCD8785805.1 DUF2294 domain-containing protein [Staphylococcus gallinarum]MCD8793601.1 DUF2294 domain-containing protein [Staphylococcus gallinarum]MCD8820758.1 DUF2294 domain-containing protein [Staphylococcus gallinarum]